MEKVKNLKQDNIMHEYLSDTIDDTNEPVVSSSIIPKDAPDWAAGVINIMVKSKQ